MAVIIARKHSNLKILLQVDVELDLPVGANIIHLTNLTSIAGWADMALVETRGYLGGTAENSQELGISSMLGSSILGSDGSIRIPIQKADGAKREKNNGDGNDCDSDEDARRDDIANVNLPLLAGLMPARYPQHIDKHTLMSTTEGDYYHGTTTMSDNEDWGADDEVDDDDGDEGKGDENVNHDDEETLFVMMILGGVIGDNRNCNG
jgi:hypothetical protein